MSDALTAKLIHWIQKIFWPLVGVAAAAIVVSFALNYKKNQDLKKISKAQDELFAIRKDVEKITFELGPKDESKKDLKLKTTQIPTKQSPEVLEKSYADVVKKLQTYINANQGTQPAVEAAMLVAEITQQYSKPDMAIESLHSALKGLKSDLFLFGVGQTELGNLYAKANKCIEAAQAWEKVIAEKNHNYLAGNLRLKAGICYEKQAQLDKAEKLYQDVVDREPTSFSGRTAKKFLLHLKYLKSKSMATGAAPSSANG